MRKFLSVIFCLMITANVFGQAKEITFGESIIEFFKGLTQHYETAWRKNKKVEYFENGKVIKTREEIEEKVRPDSRRFLRTIREGKIIDRLETVTVGENQYCRKNETAWEKSEYDCGYDDSARRTGDAVSKSYTVEETKLNGQKVRLFRRYETFYDEYGLNYSDVKFWINEKGFLIRREIEEGLTETKTLISRMTETMEINPQGLKIEAPIK